MASCLLAASLGADSFLAGTLLGPIVDGPERRVRLAIAFGACDGAASLFGAVAGGLAWTASLVVVPVAIWIAWPRLRARNWIVAVPLLLALDNLATVTPARDAPALAAISALMALAGLTLGRWLAAGARIALLEAAP